MGRVSTCEKNCNTIDLRGAQVNYTLRSTSIIYQCDTKQLNRYLINVNQMAFDIDGLVQEWRNSIALAMELRLSCTYPSINWMISFL